MFASAAQRVAGLWLFRHDAESRRGFRRAPNDAATAGIAIALAALSIGVVALRIPAPQPPAPASTAGSARAPAGETTTTEVARLRTRNARTFQRSDGRMETRISSEPVNFRDASGAWRPIDNTLVAGTARVHNRAGQYSVSLPTRLTDSIRFREGESWVAFGLTPARPVAVDLTGARATYASVQQGVSLTYEATPTALKETVILARPDAATRFKWDLRLSPGLTPRLLASGAIALRDGSGKTRLTLAAPFMTDAAGARSTNVGYALQRKTTAGWSLVMMADPRWISAPARHFPIAIDPTIGAGASADFDCALIGDAAAGTDHGSTCDTADGVEIGRGAAPDPVYDYRQLLSTFDLFQIPGRATIDAATLHLHGDSLDPGAVYHAYPISRAFTNATWTTYDGTHGWSTPGGDYEASQGVTGTVDGDNVDFDVLTMVRHWFSGALGNHGVLVKSSSEPAHFGSTQTERGIPFISLVYRPEIGVRETDAFDTYKVGSDAFLRVNLATGNLVLQTVDLPMLSLPSGDDDESETLTAGTGSLAGSRFWNTFDATGVTFGQSGRLGSGADVRLRVDDDDNRVFAAPSGYSVVFTKLPGGGYAAPPDYPATLDVHGDGTATITLPAGDQLEFSAWSSGSGGYLTRWHNDLSMSAEYASSAGVNTFATDTTDGLTTFTTAGSGSPRVTQASAPGSQLTYAYTNGLLTSVTGPDGTTSYGYTNGLLTSVNAPSGSDWTIQYSFEGLVYRVTEQPATGPAKMTSYDHIVDATVVTYPSGNVTYHLDPQHTYVDRVDSGATPPSVTLGGALISARPTLSASSQYDLDLTLSDANGLADVSVAVDGQLATGDDDPCPSSPCSLPDFFTFKTATYGPGIHNVEVFVLDDDGAQRIERFWVTVPPGLFSSDVPDEPAVDPTSEAEIARAKAYRADFGLDASDAHVRAVQGNSAYMPSAAEHSVFLTPAEEATMDDRRRLEDATTLIDDYGAEHENEYADLYIDSAGVIHVGFTGHAAQHEAALQAIFPYPSKLQVRTTQYTRDDLAHIGDEVRADLDDLEDNHGILITKIGERVVQNDVELGVRNLTPARKSFLEAEYGPAVTVVQRFGVKAAVGSRQTPQSPLLPGLEIHNVNGAVPGNNACTLGYAAFGFLPIEIHREWKKTRQGDWPAWMYFTAGHCAFDTTMSSWTQGGTLNDDEDGFDDDRRWGATWALEVGPDSFSDSMLITVESRKDINTYIWGARYRVGGKRYTARVGGVTYEYDDDVGKKVCVSGITVLVKCGKIEELFDEWRSDLPTRDGGTREALFHGMRTLNIICGSGDSGAPVYVNEIKHRKHLVNAIGIIQGYEADSDEDTEGPCVFSHIGHAITDMKRKGGIRALNLILEPGGDGDMRKGRP